MCDRSTIDWATVFNQKNAGQQCHSSCVLVEPRRSGAGGSDIIAIRKAFLQEMILLSL